MASVRSSLFYGTLYAITSCGIYSGSRSMQFSFVVAVTSAELLNLRLFFSSPDSENSQLDHLKLSAVKQTLTELKTCFVCCFFLCCVSSC